MPLIRSQLPSAFKIATVPILAWFIVVLTYVWDGDPIALSMIRGAALVVAVPGTLYVPLAILALKFWKVSDAK